jgi:VRR-NUC domain
MAATTEEQMISKILQYVRTKGIMCWRQNNVGSFRADDCITSFVEYIVKGRYDGKSQRQLLEDVQRIVRFSYTKLAGTAKGVSDILAVSPNGKWIAIEVKIGSDRLSPEQEVWLQEIKRKGGYAFVVRNFEFFKTQFDSKLNNQNHV